MPNADKIQWPQGEPQFNTHWRAVTEGLAGSGIVNTGDLEVTATANALEIQVAAGTMWYTGATYSLGSATTLTLTTGDATYDRWDTIYFDTATASAGVHSGTAQANPTPPDVTGDELLLATVYVPSSATDVADSNILNWRTHSNDADNTYLKDSGGKFNSDTVEGALQEVGSPDSDEFSTSEAGSVQGADAGNVYTTNVPNGETLNILQAGFILSDGQAAPSGLDLVIAVLDGTGGATKQTTVITGDGTIQNDVTGNPVASYSNSSGSAQSVAIMVDNGYFNTGTGSSKDVFTTARGEVV